MPDLNVNEQLNRLNNWQYLHVATLFGVAVIILLLLFK